MCVSVLLFLTKKTSCENVLGQKGIKESEWDWRLVYKPLLLGAGMDTTWQSVPKL